MELIGHVSLIMTHMTMNGGHTNTFKGVSQQGFRQLTKKILKP